ncbi:MAG: signal peptidase II, partial [Hyphomonadaceae bacterium]|nr:signal peptidase II [Hyphomonadaceae bacterium]
MNAHARRNIRAGLLIAFAVLVLDQASKHWVLAGVRLQDIGKIELSPVFDLSFVANYGVSFGLLQADQLWGRLLLILLSGAIAAFFVYWLRSAQRTLTVAALGLVIGGALGNLIDRARFGYVVDFLD